jgi:uncharacterized damage-inducible protein DinB
VIDDMLARWTYTRSMTTDFLTGVTDDCLDYRPAAHFMTVREQASHIVEVQSLYQLALLGEAVDFARKPEFTPAADDVATLVAALGKQDDELHAALGKLRADPASFSIDWYGNVLGIDGWMALFIQHESLHHGQWAAMATMGGFDRPLSWLLNWGL